ncbi:hypothetical protein AC578_5249 [Pseudocercospora eumusae]|uniref:Uncharacterized protein n=1 Tax=Pseudocercospora eumusae TaxID=321146 RepID=A0A139GZC0_9PEZI|nr:hypothetical protein AC578_5249 [Pseudocercospora eumusae]
MAASTTDPPSTTINFPTDTPLPTLLTATVSELNLAATGPSLAVTTLSGGVIQATLKSGFALWIPVTVQNPKVVTVQAMVSALIAEASTVPNPSPAYCYPVPSALAGTPNTAPWSLDATSTLSQGSTLWIPYNARLTDTISVRNYVTRLQKALQASPSTLGLPVSTTTTSGLGTSSSQTQTVSNSGASPSSTNTDSKSGRFDSGALAGGIIGAFLLGLCLAGLAWYLLGRRRSRERVGAGQSQPWNSGTSSGDDAASKFEAESKKGAVLTSWERHLAQEKDDATIVNAVRSVFEHVQIHVEGYYSASSARGPLDQVQALESYSSGKLSPLLSKTGNPLPLLEGIMVRWIVPRISLRSSAYESLLPSEFTRVPGKSGWHMESEGHKAKKDLPEAFAQWRVLTGHLFPNARDDPEFRQALDANIDSAVRTLTKALSPWALPGQNDADRMESLHQILHQASDVGILLFTQPSTLVFDWTNLDAVSERSAVINPALIRDTAGNKRESELKRVLLKARLVQV